MRSLENIRNLQDSVWLPSIKCIPPKNKFTYIVLSVDFTVFVGETEILNRFVGESSLMKDSVMLSVVWKQYVSLVGDFFKWQTSIFLCTGTGGLYSWTSTFAGCIEEGDGFLTGFCVVSLGAFPSGRGSRFCIRSRRSLTWNRRFAEIRSSQGYSSYLLQWRPRLELWMDARSVEFGYTILPCSQRFVGVVLGPRGSITVHSVSAFDELSKSISTL